MLGTRETAVKKVGKHFCSYGDDMLEKGDRKQEKYEICKTYGVLGSIMF